MDFLNVKDMNDLVLYCNNLFSNKYTLCDFTEWIDTNILNINSYFDKILAYLYNSNESILLKDSNIGDKDAYNQIIEIMKNLHYDNGISLICESNNYFEQYDRDQDFACFYNEYLIYDFVTDGKNLYIRINLSLEELRELLRDMYDGASYIHDFG